jgi:hypothetical protein
MVNKSALFYIDEMINKINKRMKPWNERSRVERSGKLNPQIKRMKKKIRCVLATISGNAITEMLKGNFAPLKH